MERAKMGQLCTVPEAARRSGLGLRQLRRAIADGTLDVFDVGSWPRVRWRDVQAWIEGTRRTIRNGLPDPHDPTEKGQ